MFFEQNILIEGIVNRTFDFVNIQATTCHQWEVVHE